MGRCLLSGKEAEMPYEVEELDLRLYSIEELCYYIYHHPSLIDDDFIDDHLLTFLQNELDLPEEADKIRRFYKSPSDQDATLLMLLSDVGYYTAAEIQELQRRLISKRRKNGPERILLKADALFSLKRYMKAIRYYRYVFFDREDGRITAEMRAKSADGIANSFGMLYDYEDALKYLEFAYDEMKNDNYLKKMLFVSMISDAALPQELFRNVSNEKVKEWEQEYLLTETGIKNRIHDRPEMQVFFKDKDTIEQELKNYVESGKKEYRSALE